MPASLLYVPLCQSFQKYENDFFSISKFHRERICFRMAENIYWHLKFMLCELISDGEQFHRDLKIKVIVKPLFICTEIHKNPKLPTLTFITASFYNKEPKKKNTSVLSKS